MWACSGKKAWVAATAGAWPLSTAYASADLALRLALWVSALSLLSAVLLLVQMLLLRVVALRRDAIEQQVTEQWRAVLLQAAADGCVTQAPLLRSSHRAAFLVLWVRMQDSLRGSARDGLNRLAEHLDVPPVARRWVRWGGAAHRMLGLSVLGHLRQADDWPLIERWLNDPRSFVSLAAARALLQLDAQRAMPLVLDEYLSRIDWAVSRLATLLKEAGPQAAGPALAERLQNTKPQHQLRLLPLARMTEAPGAGSATEAVLNTASAPPVLAAALQQVYGPTSLPRVRKLAAHPEWLVRSYAALALGRIGGEAEHAVLKSLLSDEQWWVRYRAAQALLALQGPESATALLFEPALGEGPAREMLLQARAEAAFDAGLSPPPLATAAGAAP
jgi:HEAT repeat protein